jgi:hypothetical protein
MRGKRSLFPRRVGGTQDHQLLGDLLVSMQSQYVHEYPGTRHDRQPRQQPCRHCPPSKGAHTDGCKQFPLGQHDDRQDGREVEPVSEQLQPLHNRRRPKEMGQGIVGQVGHDEGEDQPPECGAPHVMRQPRAYPCTPADPG